MRILFIGDIVGKPGREILRRLLPGLVERHTVDLVIANAENAAGGNGVTRDVAQAIRHAGVDVMTSGNHIWDKKEALSLIETEPRLLRPANYPDAPGLGHVVVRTPAGMRVGVINIMGRVFMNPLDNPFVVIERELRAVEEEGAEAIFVDFHAEATSEKLAMGWHLDGRVAAVVGTHTHVQTADDRVLPGGTAYITDVGMTGPHASVIGVQVEPVLRRFLNGMPARFETATQDPRLHGVLVTVGTDGRATAIERLSLTSADAERSAPATVS